MMKTDDTNEQTNNGGQKTSNQTILSIIIIILLYFYLSAPKSYQTIYGSINTSLEPIQTSYTGGNITKNRKKQILNINPLANYEISAVVLSKKRYYSSWDGELAPFDLALGWGNISKPEIYKKIEFDQSLRRYHYRPKTQMDLTEIGNHSANNHIIPSNTNIFKAIKKIKKGDYVTIYGYLVNIDGKIDGQQVFRNSSVSRTDTGNEACELIYVTKIRINSKMYN